MPVTWKVDPTFTEDERLSIREAMQAWSEATNNQVKWVILNSLEPTSSPACPTQFAILNTPGSTPVGALAALRVDHRGSTVAKALVSCKPRAIFILTDRVTGTPTVSRHEMLRRVMMHEIGHQLGLRHLLTGIMTDMITDAT
jgi:hypothetical protein